MKNKSKSKKMVRIDLPAAVFDVEGAYVMRKKRIAIWRLDAIKECTTADEVYSLVAALIPTWYGVLDVDTDEPLGDPELDPKVFGHLDAQEQWPWLVGCLQASPKGQASRGPDQTQ